MKRSIFFCIFLSFLFLIESNSLLCSEKPASLEVVTGLMGRGKTETLIDAAKEASVRSPKNVLAFFHHFDLERQNDETRKGLHSRNGKFFPAKSVKNGNEIVKTYELFKKTESKKPYLVVIDEGHFFDETLIKAVEKITQQNTDVLVGGLLYTFLKEKFKTVDQLLSLAENHTRLKPGKCVKCETKEAKWMQRIIIENGQEKPASRKDPIVLVGKEDCYRRHCEDCHTIPD